MNTDEWGPRAWFFIHSVAFNYPNNPTKYDKLNYKNFFTHLGNILPCEFCNISYNMYF